jgi:mRNA-degrading endonuclease toxin of MazEF toxin-antitoxin module
MWRGDEPNQLEDSYVMADKPHTMPITRLGARIGTASTSVMVDVERALLVCLDLAG